MKIPPVEKIKWEPVFFIFTSRLTDWSKLACEKSAIHGESTDHGLTFVKNSSQCAEHEDEEYAQT